MEVVKILVADDSKDVRDQMLNLLVKLGHTDITIAENGKSAIDKIINEIDKYLSFDLIILDQNTSKLDGMEVLESLRIIPQYEKTPVIFMTETTDKDFIVKAIETGANGFLSKPIVGKTLKQEIGKHIK